MFSVIIPLYNKEAYIAATLQSVLKQTFHNFEVIIINDGSTDGSIHKIKKFIDDRIKIVNQKNAGVSVARNRGIEEAKYDFITFLDADDLWEIDFLETILKLQKKYPSSEIIALNYKILYSDGQKKLPIINGLSEDFTDGILQNYFKIASISDPIICSISFAVQKKAIESIGGFPVGIRAGEDLLTWAKLAAHYDIAYSIEPKAIFNRLGKGQTSTPRIPDTHDRVSQELKKLLTLSDQSKTVGLQDYIAYWHKIRLAIFLRLKKSEEAKEEFQKMAEFAKKDLKFFIYALLVYSPPWAKNFLNKFILRLNSYRRKYLSSTQGKP
jgi:glycosyltransferase involved in cell wall biosynthesis